MVVEDSASSQGFLVRELNLSDRQRWDDFVLQHPEATFFHLSGWKEIIEKSLGHQAHFLYCERDGEICSVLPIAQVKSWLFGNAFISLPFLVYGGVVSIDRKAEELVVDAACELTKQAGADYLELRCKTKSTREWPVKSTHVTFTKQIDTDPNKNLMAIPRKQRAMIRKGAKAGLVAEKDSDVSRLHAAMLVCKRNLGTPFFAQRYLQDVLETFGKDVEITTVTRNRELVCSVMSFRFRNEILPYYGGGGELARKYHGNDFMYWTVMEDACQNGVEIFDYGRSQIGGGAYRFKKNWGFEPSPLHYEFFLLNDSELPSLNPTNSKYRLMIDTWKRLPLGIAGRLGPPIARRIG